MLYQLHPGCPAFRLPDGSTQIGVERPLIFLLQGDLALLQRAQNDSTESAAISLPINIFRQMLAALRQGCSETELTAILAGGNITWQQMQQLLGNKLLRCRTPLSLHKILQFNERHGIDAQQEVQQKASKTTAYLESSHPMTSHFIEALADFGMRQIVLRETTPIAPEKLPEQNLYSPQLSAIFPQKQAALAKRYNCALASNDLSKADPACGHSFGITLSYGPPHFAQWAPLMFQDIPFLSIWVRWDGSITIGPLYLPSAAGCPNCLQQRLAKTYPNWTQAYDNLSRTPRLTASTSDIFLAISHTLQILEKHLSQPAGNSVHATADVDTNASHTRQHHDHLWDWLLNIHNGKLTWQKFTPHPECLCAATELANCSGRTETAMA